MTLNEAIELLEDNGFMIVESPNRAVLKHGIGGGWSGGSGDDWYGIMHSFVKIGNALIRDGFDPELAEYADIWEEFKPVAERNPKYYCKILGIDYGMNNQNSRPILVKIIKNIDKLLKTPSMVDRVKNAVGIKPQLEEDFGIGVGAPCGLDQGIPHGGDCKGVAPVRMGLYQRSPFSANPFFRGVPDAHHPAYWLNQIPKKKKKKKKKVHKTIKECFEDLD